MLPYLMQSCDIFSLTGTGSRTESVTSGFGARTSLLTISSESSVGWSPSARERAVSGGGIPVLFPDGGKDIFRLSSFAAGDVYSRLRPSQVSIPNKKFWRHVSSGDVLHTRLFEANILCSQFPPKKKKRQNVAKLQSHKKGPGHKQIVEIQRPPEVASKTQSPVRKEARCTISPEQIDC